MIEHLDWSRLRRAMVEQQLRPGGVRDERVLEAMARVERHRFVPEESRSSSYDDTPLPIGDGQTISQPLMVALMTQALQLVGDEKVLEIGTGSGYQTAVLAELGCTVDTVERYPFLARAARKRLEELGYSRVRVHEGDGSMGLPDEAPFERILVTAAGPNVPASLLRQLDPEEGVLVMPIGSRGYQELIRVVRNAGGYAEENLGGCRFVPLVGEEGWREE